jgi:cytochrome P450
MGTATDLYWDPIDEGLDDDPYPLWRRMRDEAPLYRNDRFGFWALSRFADVEAAHRDPATFSSAHGTVLELMDNDMSGSGQLIFMDPPSHTILRALVSRAFTPRRMAALDDHIRAICAELLDPLVGREEFDYVQDFAAQVPSRVIAELVGVPEDEREEQRQNIDAMFHIEPGVGMINDVSLNAQIAVYTYLSGLIERKKDHPGDDLISVLCGSSIVDEDGVERRLTDGELANFANLLFSAGTETVMRLLGNAAVLLAGYPDQRADLVAEPEVIPNAVEELLRFEPPSPVQGRYTLRDVELHDTVVPAGSKVLLLTGSAGRDEREYGPDADHFDVRRQFRQHVSFGYGIHFCVGANLARVEGRIALEETLKRFPSWELVPGGTVRQHTSTVRGYSKVQVRPGT